jgi:cobalt/nickel transport system ATP-binding protein
MAPRGLPGGGPSAAVEIRGLTYAYPDGVAALDHLDLTVAEGEKVAVIGSNGAGKSTLLELLAGFHFPFQGDVRIMGEVLTKENAARARRHLGLVFQDPDDQVFMPRVWDDVAFGPKNLAWPPERVADAVDRTLKEMGIEDLKDRAPHRLSYGQKKRVAIAGVLAMEPEILLLDEPSSGLDARSRTDLLARLATLDRTLVLATHSVEEAAWFVDRLVVLGGRKLAEGRPRDILAQGDLLTAAGLEVPTMGRLFRALGELGVPFDPVPLSVEEAFDRLAEVLGSRTGAARERAAMVATNSNLGSSND